MYNRLKCYYRSLIILLSHSYSCDSIFPVEQKGNFPTDLHTYYVFTQEGPSHSLSLHLRTGAAPHQHPPSKPGLDDWMYFVYLKMLWREICSLCGGKAKGYNALVPYACTDSIHSLNCKWILNWYKKSTGYNSGHLNSTLKVSFWVPSISQSNLLFLKALGRKGASSWHWMAEAI